MRLIVVDKKSIQSPLSYRFVAVVSIDRGFVALVVLVPLRVLVLVLGVLGVLVLVLVLVLVVLVVLVVGIALTLIGSVIGIMITLLPIAINRYLAISLILMILVLKHQNRRKTNEKWTIKSSHKSSASVHSGGRIETPGNCDFNIHSI